MELNLPQDFLTKKGITTNTEKDSAATEPKTAEAVAVSDDKKNLDEVVNKSMEPAKGPEKPEEIVAENTDKVDLSKEPEPAPSIQDNMKATEKVIKAEAKKDKPEEAAKEWYDTDKPTAEIKEPKSEKSTEEVDYRTMAEEYESLLKDPLIEAIIAAKKSGKNPMDFYNEIKPIDYNKMQPEQLFELELKKLGVTDDSFTEAMDEFKAMPKWKQLKEVEPLKVNLEKENSERLKRFHQDANHQREAQAQLRKKTELSLDKELDAIYGKELFGMKITDAERDVLKNTVLNELAVRTRDGQGIDIQRSLELALWDKFKKEVVRANINKARASAMEETFKETVRPTAKTVETSRIPEISKEERAQQAKESFIKRQAGIYN